ncbi:hypothetical protein [Dokdonia sp.]|uniref:hypothetical protein n=1 Tax=Dokdonia sp. TaxID=2024995 RepID=UPI003265188B
MTPKYQLHSNDILTQHVKKHDVNSWEELVSFIRALPYGRNTNRTDLSLVIKEKKGTCSSKHAFLKKIADLNNIPSVKLILGMYKMSEANTPKIGAELTTHHLDYIPEAHCYLKINNKRVDITSSTSQFSNIEQDILQEREITPEQVAHFKVDYHKDYIKKWIIDQDTKFTFDALWKIRETCIKNLTES